MSHHAPIMCLQDVQLQGDPPAPTLKSKGLLGAHRLLKWAATFDYSTDPESFTFIIGANKTGVKTVVEYCLTEI